MKSIPDFDLVLFGGTGDLVMRKLLPALYRQHQSRALPASGRIIALGRSIPDTPSYIERTRTLIRSYLGEAYNEKEWEAFSSRLAYQHFEARQEDDYLHLAETLHSFPDRIRVFYLSTAPDLFSLVCQNLARVHVNTKNSRVVLEKPLGQDLASAEQIITEVGQYFTEDQIYRIDHYLGKEPVQNLFALRFGNALFEPLWRREWIRNVQITVTEEVGVEGRANFYDKTGALRDMVQNHLLQLLSIVAMEPPPSMNADAIRDEKLKVLRSLKPLPEDNLSQFVVRGQYGAGASNGLPVVGYLEEPGIPSDSRTETFVAIKAEVSNWRWAGVPFYLRTGKRMQERLAEIIIHFREVPHSIFGSQSMVANKLVIRLQPEESIRLYMMAKKPGDQISLSPAHLDLDFKEFFQTRAMAAYERLIKDVICGDLALFVRSDELCTAWRWVEPILEAWERSADSPKRYTAGTWGPAASSALLSRDGLCWHEEA